MAKYSWFMAYRHGGKLCRSPSQQDVNGNEGSLILAESFAQLGPECSEGANLHGVFRTHEALEGHLGYYRRNIPPEAMLLRLRRSIDDVVSLFKPGKQPRNFFRWILEVVVNRDDKLVICLADAAQQGVMLAVVAHQVDAVKPMETFGQRDDGFPASITAAIVDEDYLEGLT